MYLLIHIKLIKINFPTLTERTDDTQIQIKQYSASQVN